MIDIHNKAFQQQVKMELARRELWEYCKLKAPDFYNEKRPYLRDMTQTLQWFIEESTAQILVMNVPPRHGKSRTGGNTKGSQTRSLDRKTIVKN